MATSPPPSIIRTPPSSRTKPTVGDPVHMLKERGDLKEHGRKPAGARGVSVRAGCGAEGNPYDGTKGMRTTIWPSMVTCDACRALPSVTPVFAGSDLGNG